MAHTYISSLVHCVFSTKNREKRITEDLRPKLWAYIGGIARANALKAVAIGGTDDHVHVLLSVPPTMALAKAVQLIKGGSSKWLREQFDRRFSWQEAYAAFTISVSHRDATIAYIAAQPEHHKKRDFQQEFIAFLKKHNIDYDPRYVWG